MKRNRLNFVLDAASVLVFLALLETGLIVKYILPPGSGGRGGGQALTLWGWSRHDWGEIHFWLSAGFVALMLAHVALHWRWVCDIVRHALQARSAAAGEPIRGLKAVSYGIGFLAVVLLLTAGPFWWGLHSVSRSHGTASGRNVGGWRGGQAARVTVSSIGGGSTAEPPAETLDLKGGHRRDRIRGAVEPSAQSAPDSELRDTDRPRRQRRGRDIRMSVPETQSPGS